MKKNLTIFILLFYTFFSSLIFAQDAPVQPTKISRAVYFDVSPALRDVQIVPPTINNDEGKEIPNKIGAKEYFNRENIPFLLSEDPVWQKQDATHRSATFTPIQNFEGIPNILGFYPPDTQGDVSADHYVQVVNVNFAIYSKTGTIVFGPANLNTLWAGIPSPWNTTNSGDPVVLFDQEANRWLITQFSLPSGLTNKYAELVAVSQTSDPTGEWYRYVFEYGNLMPDYPKFGVWPDGYYMSTNQFLNGSSWAGAGATAFERAKMIAGDPSAQMIYFNLGLTGDPSSMLPSDWDGPVTPVTGEPNHFSYINYWTGPDDYLRTWDFHVDWIIPANSTFAQVSSLATAPFDPDLCVATRERCIPQPGTGIKLESLSDRLMYRLQYRNFGTYRAMVTNHTVDVDGSGHAGIRWYELRNTGAGWSIYQQGTWSPDASHRWVGSIAMNSVGDMALGYSVSDATSIYPSIRYTGRKSGDPLGTMSITEQNIITGTGSQTGTSARWGDYSMMSVDPSDDVTFWYTTEYIQTTGLKSWRTRIASLNISSAPMANSAPATLVMPTTATLNGTVNPNGLTTDYHFEYGTTMAYGNSTPSVSAGSGTSAVPVSANIITLVAGNTYHFRVVAVNTDGTSNSNDLTFVPGAAVLTTTVPSSITPNTASSGGNISSDGGFSVTDRGICWGLAINPKIAGNHTTDGPGTGSYTSAISGLSGGTSYHVRAYATNGAGTSYGNDLVFTTSCDEFYLPFTEPFSTTLIPSCWTQVDHIANGQVWQFGTIYSYGSLNPSLTGNYAFLNSYNYGSGGGGQNADLITPSLDLSDYASVSLSFNYQFLHYSAVSETGSVSYSINNGATWVVLASFTTASANPASFSQSIPTVSGQAEVKFKWNYTSANGYWFAIDDVQISGIPLFSWTGSVSNLWSDPNNWFSNVVPILSDNVYIPDVTNDPVVDLTPGTPAVCNNLTIDPGAVLTVGDGKALTVYGTLTNNAGAGGLIIQSTSVGTGSLIQGTTAVEGTMQRYIPQRTDALHGWHFLSSPVEPQAIQTEFVPNPPSSGTQAFFSWDEPTALWLNTKDGSGNWAAGFESDFIEGKGYLVNYPSVVTKNFASMLHVLDVAKPGLTKSATTYSGWNLLGNPFSSGITWHTSWSLTNIAAVAKIWNSGGASYSDINPGDIIPATQGFMVHVTTNPGSVTIPAAARTHSSQAWYKSSGDPLIMLKANDLAGQTFQESVIRFNPESTVGYDSDFDAYFLEGYAPQFYSVEGGMNLSTNVLPGMDWQTIIPFSFIKTDGSGYSIEAVKLENISQPVYLIDLKFNNTQNLSEHPLYSFTSLASDDPARFLVAFRPLGIEAQSGSGYHIYIYNGTLFITNPGESTLEVYNTLGQKMVGAQTHSELLYSLKLDVTTGYYLVRLTTGQKVITEKVFVK
jgi:hypothetical protein